MEELETIMVSLTFWPRIIVSARFFEAIGDFWAFFDLVFLKGFVSNLAATLVGAGVGFFLALVADRYLAARREQKEATARTRIEMQTRRQLLLAFKEAVEKNLALVNQMEKELKPGTIIFYNVDLTLLESLSSAKFQTIIDLDLTKAIESLRYELQHLHRKVELQLEMHYGVARSREGYPADRASLLKAIQAHLPRIKSEAKDVRRMLEDELVKLAN